jgi:hypothetical protein
MTDELESIFDETPETPVETPVETPPEIPEEDTQTGEDETATPAEPKSVPLAALLDERRKAQQLKAELEDIKRKLPPQTKEPDMYEDPEGYKAWIKAEARREFEEAEKKRWEETVEISRSAMLEKHDDYEKMEKYFLFLSREDESLIKAMKNSNDPALFAYEKGKAYFDEMTTPPKVPKSKSAAPSLVIATSRGSNTTPVERDVGLNEMFSDQRY